MELLNPVHGIGDEERFHLWLAVIIDACGPVWMLIHHWVGQLIAACAVKLVKTIRILREVRRHPVKNHADILRMAAVDKDTEIFRRSVAMRGRKIAGDLIPPRRLIRVLHNGHQLDMRVAHLLHIRHQRIGKLGEGIITAVVMPFPRTSMHLIDVDGSVQ